MKIKPKPTHTIYHKLNQPKINNQFSTLPQQSVCCVVLNQVIADPLHKFGACPDNIETWFLIFILIFNLTSSYISFGVIIFRNLTVLGNLFSELVGIKNLVNTMNLLPYSSDFITEF